MAGVDRKQWLALTAALACLFAGLVVYANLRDDDLVLHTWMRHMNMLDVLRAPGKWLDALNLPQWFVNALPDGLWMCALGLVIGAIWNFRWHRLSAFWYGCALTAGLGYEGLQGAGLAPGVFDWMDVLFILVGGMLPVGLFRFSEGKSQGI